MMFPLTRMAWGGLLAMVALLGVVTLHAQEKDDPKAEASPKAKMPKGGYKEHREVKEPTRDAIRTFNQIMSTRGGLIEPDDQPAFNSVMRYQLAEFTFPEVQPQLPKKRIDMKNRLKSAGNAEVLDAHRLYRNAARTEMAKYLGPEYHPFVRVNAMLVIAELNEREPSTNNQEPPVPDLESLKIMLAAVGDNSQLDGVKACAMMGMERHAQLGINDEKLKLDTLKASLAMLKPGQHEWLRRRAVITLANLGAIGRESEVPKALLALMASKDESMGLRTEAARAFGWLDFATGPRINFAEAVVVLAHLTGDAIAATNSEEGRTDRDILALETYLTRIEVALAGKPDVQGFSVEKKPPVSGMILALQSAEDPQRKLLDDFLIGRLTPLTKLVYGYNPEKVDASFFQNLNAAAEQVNLWVQVHPIDGKEPEKKAPEKAVEAKQPAKADGAAPGGA